jgi:hypothetical protein
MTGPAYQTFNFDIPTPIYFIFLFDLGRHLGLLLAQYLSFYLHLFLHIIKNEYGNFCQVLVELQYIPCPHSV